MRSKTILKHTLALFLLLCITLTSLLSLASCSIKAGSDELLPLEELAGNVRDSEDLGYTYVASYLDAWDFPAFNLGKMKDVEYVFAKNYFEPLPDAYELAVMTAESFLEHHYGSIDVANTDATTDLLLKSYVASAGDAYSFYRTAEEYESFVSSGSGTLVGIGIMVTEASEGYGIVIEEVIEDSPAEAAGLLAGDLIIAVDGVSLEGYDLDSAADLITGEIGTSVTLTVKRGEATHELTAVRATVIRKSVTYSLDDGKIGYISITAFNQNTDEQFEEALDYMRENGVRAIIYDLRSNLGGYLDSVVNMISEIAPSGATLVTFTGGGFEPITDLDPDSLSLPSVILVNEMTASAAELFTSAVRDLSDEGGYETVIVGKKTYGKGIMQSSYTFSDGSGVTLTIAYYNPPSGENYQGIGIAPDVEAEYTAERDYQLEAAYAEAQKLLIKK